MPNKKTQKKFLKAIQKTSNKYKEILSPTSIDAATKESNDSISTLISSSLETIHLLPHEKFSTKAIHSGNSQDNLTGSLVPPIYLTTTYAQNAPGNLKNGYDYSRSVNPTRETVEACIKELEYANHCLVFSSGCSAINCVLSLLKAGDHVLYCDDVYGREVVKLREDVNIEFADMTDLKALQNRIRSNTKMIFLESPTNPTLKIINIQKVSEIANKDILVVVDNTFASPYLQSPLKLGADICLNSCTKFIAGHHDVIMGSVSCNRSDLLGKMLYVRTYYGYVPGAFDCYLCLRGLKTLKVRMVEHCKNTYIIAKYLEKHPKIIKVLYPGLESHPGHELAKVQMKGFGGMLGFYLKGNKEDVKKLCQNVKVFTCAASLGGVESLITVPDIMTHPDLEFEIKEHLGINDNLVRLSVGIENAEDLIEDLEQALDKL